MEHGNASYTNYQNMVAQVNTSMVQMEKICGRMELDENKKSLEKSREKLAEHKFAVGIMGEFKRGKSTVINSMLEKEIMPADILPCSATMNRVTYDMQPHVELLMKDNSIKNISIDDLAGYVTKLTGENEARASQVEEAVVYYPCRFCQNGVDIVDTPGLNDDERMNRVTEEVIPKLDAVIMVITPDNPFSMSEAEFVRSKLMASDLGRLIFLVNKIDTIRRAADRERVVQGIREKIQRSVLDKMAELYGKDSEKYKDSEFKMGNIRIYPFSALDALDGKMTGDQKLIEESGTLPFEEALTKMLTEERGALELGTPLNLIQRTSLEVIKAAETRKKALELDAEEFEKHQKEALAKIGEMRKKKQEEKRRLSSSATNAKNKLIPQVSQFYSELEAKLAAKLENTPIDVTTLSSDGGKKAAAEKLQKAVSDEMRSSMSLFSEKIELQLQDIVGKEAVRLGEFTQEISTQMDAFRNSITENRKGLDKTNLIGTGVDVLTDFMGIYGIGGIVAGYREAGVKGALAGGGVGLVANLTVAAILGSMSIVGLPMLIISCATGTAVSKHFTSKLFARDSGKRKLEELRREIRDNMKQMIVEMQAKRELENWVHQRVEIRFNELTASMEEECEKMLNDTESTMDNIKKDLTRNELQRKQMAAECDEIVATVKQILENLKPLNMKVRQVLESA